MVSVVEKDALSITTLVELISVTSSTFHNIGTHVFDLSQNTSLFVSNTTISGTVGVGVFTFFSNGNQVLAGSSGNINATTNNPTLCDATFGGAFSGTIGFVDGTTLMDNVAPCN